MDPPLRLESSEVLDTHTPLTAVVSCLNRGKDAWYALDTQDKKIPVYDPVCKVNVRHSFINRIARLTFQNRSIFCYLRATQMAQFKDAFLLKSRTATKRM